MAFKHADVHFASRLAIQSLRVVLGLALIAIAALIAERFVFQRSIATSWVNIQKISAARSLILLTDEQLTMSAVAYALSGEETWRQRYQAAMPKFDEAVQKVKSLVDPEKAKAFESEIEEAHDTLASLEQLVLDLGENGERLDAANVFTSPRYVNNKLILENAINLLLTEADSQAKADLAWTQHRALLFGAVSSVLAMVGFFWLSRRLNRALRKAEFTFEESQRAYLEQLAANHEAKLKTSRMEQLGALTATMAHELRNPLGAVRTSSFMLERLWAQPDERILRVFGRINSGIERCDNLISQLLEFAQLASSEKQAIEFDTWLNSSLREMAKTLNASIELTCVLAAPGVKVEMDAAQMQKAISRLLANASEAMINRAGQLETIAMSPPVVRITTTASESVLTLVLEDNGHGISPENLPRLLDPFFTTKNFGAGLGLPTVQRIVEQHQGRLVIEGASSAGATVKITLPAA